MCIWHIRSKIDPSSYRNNVSWCQSCSFEKYELCCIYYLLFLWYMFIWKTRKLGFLVRSQVSLWSWGWQPRYLLGPEYQSFLTLMRTMLLWWTEMRIILHILLRDSFHRFQSSSRQQVFLQPCLIMELRSEVESILTYCYNAFFTKLIFRERL